MTGGFRQSMAWLHTWSGLLFGWVLAAIFVAGTLSVFAGALDEWMAADPVEARGVTSGDREFTLDQRSHAVELAARHLEDQSAQTQGWSISTDGHASWLDAAGQSRQWSFDPLDGRTLAESGARATEGGHHFVRFHYSLHADIAGIVIVGLTTAAMLVALVTGIVIHHRIFKDIFTLRLGKGQRSWLDGHNVASVLTLPFQLTIGYTGLAIFHYFWMPAAIAYNFGLVGGLAHQFDHVGPYFDARRAQTAVLNPMPGAVIDFAALPELVSRAQQLSGLHAEWIAREVEGSAAGIVRIGMLAADIEALPSGAQTIYQVLPSGEMVQEVRGSAGSAEVAFDLMVSLHEARFGGLTVRWLWFLAGTIGCVMIATGLVLFTLKRRTQGERTFGAATPTVFRLIDALNVAAVAGVVLASVAYLWANRLLAVELPGRELMEIRVFFLTWAVSLLHALIRPARAWREQLGLIAIMCLCLPLLNAITTGDWLALQARRGNWVLFAVEAVAIVIGACFAVISLRMTRTRP